MLREAALYPKRYSIPKRNEKMTMRIFNNIDEIDITDNTAVALGNFDGLHTGHMHLIRSMKRTAEKKGLVPAVFTFSNHPSEMISGEKVPEIIYAEEKAELLREEGIGYMFNIPFTEEIMTMSPEDYVRKLLVGKFRAKDAFCGFNYRFGAKAAGDTKLFSELADQLGFELHVMSPFTLDGRVVSSTIIRDAVMGGEMKEADALLGRPYAIRGTVSVGNRLGRTIGFPTCNISVDEGMVAPANGVYQTVCIVDGEAYDAVTNVGVKPTIGVFEKNIETNILDFDRDIYGEVIEVRFIGKIRDEKKFGSIDELKEQIGKDRETARKMHAMNR